MVRCDGDDPSIDRKVLYSRARSAQKWRSHSTDEEVYKNDINGGHLIYFPGSAPWRNGLENRRKMTRTSSETQPDSRLESGVSVKSQKLREKAVQLLETMRIMYGSFQRN